MHRLLQQTTTNCLYTRTHTYTLFPNDWKYLFSHRGVVMLAHTQHKDFPISLLRSYKALAEYKIRRHLFTACAREVVSFVKPADSNPKKRKERKRKNKHRWHWIYYRSVRYCMYQLWWSWPCYLLGTWYFPTHIWSFMKFHWRNQNTILTKDGPRCLFFFFFVS